MRLVVALALALMTAFAAPVGAAEQTQVIPFHLNPNSTSQWIATVPAHGTVWIEVVFTQGVALTDITMDGPGACSGVSLGTPVATPVTPAASTRVECGALFPHTVDLSLSLLAGEVSGYMVLHGVAAHAA
jgi:hypothetical protein